MFIRSTSQLAGLLLKTQGSAVWSGASSCLDERFREKTANQPQAVPNRHGMGSCNRLAYCQGPARKRSVLRILKREPEATRVRPVPDGHMTSLIRTVIVRTMEGYCRKGRRSHVIHAPLWCRVPRCSASLMNSTRNKVNKRLLPPLFRSAQHG